MNPEGDDAKTILAEALRLSAPAERTAYLDGACAGDPALRQEVESLLHAHDQAGGFLAQTVQLPMPEVDLERAGARIGRYKLLEQIGEGGFGVVYMAEQEEPVRRRVALKIIKLGMDTKEVVARFEAERQALAMMDHPNIASVFDGGATDTGRPYFVMELVKGIAITDYCDANRLPTHERLELFMQVCQAVQHAHQKGIIHRDLKPSNILVTVKDDRPVPKVIDFGVAKATQARLTEKTLFTRFQQWIGTPAYMSPEQAGLGSLDVDTRSDIYSLGVLLYELLTGRTPFDTQKLLAAGYDAVMRTIREEEPPKPSTRLSTLAQAELRVVAAKRGAEPGKLGRMVRGDLDWIVMKALEKDRQRRYETASALAQEVNHYLHHEPVSAAAPSAFYRAQRFVLRNRMAVGFSVALALSLFGGTIFSAWQAWRAKQSAREAETQRFAATNEAARAVRFAEESSRARLEAEASAYSSRILLASQSLEKGDIENAEKNLDACPEKLRGWEWKYLKRQLHRESFSVPSRATNAITLEELLTGLAAFNDKRIWTSRYPGEGTCYDTARRKLFTFPTNWVPALPTSDGLRILSQAKSNSPAVLRAIDSGKVLATFQAAPGMPLAISSDETLVASWEATVSGTELSTNRILISSLTNGQLLQSLTVAHNKNGLYRGQENNAILWSPDARWIVAGSAVMERSSGREVLHFEAAHYGNQVAFSPDSRLLCVSTGSDLDAASVNCDFAIWDLDTRQKVFQRALQFLPITVAFAGGNETMVVGGIQIPPKSGRRGPFGTDDLAFFDAKSGELQRSFRIDSHLWVKTRISGQDVTFFGVCALVVSRDGKRVAAGSLDGSLHVIEIAKPEYHEILRGHTNLIAAVAFDATGDRLVSLDLSGQVKLWNLDPNASPAVSGTDKSTLKLLSADGRTLVWQEAGCTKVANLERRETLVLPDTGYLSQISPDGHWLMQEDKIWDTRLGILVHRLWEGTNRQEVLGFSGNNQRAALLSYTPGSWNRSLRVEVIDLQTWKGVAAPLTTDWESGIWPPACALNHEGTRAAVSASQTIVRVFSLTEGKAAPTLLEEFPGSPPYAFGPDGSWLLSCNTNGGFQKTDVRSGRIHRSFPGRNPSGGFEVSRSGRHVRTRSNYVEEWAEIWNINTGELVASTDSGFRCVGAVFSPDAGRLAFQGSDSLLRVWDLDHESVLMVLPMEVGGWGWAQNGDKLTIIRSELRVLQLDGSPWSPQPLEVMPTNTTPKEYRELNIPRKTSIPGVELEAWLYRTGGGAQTVGVAGDSRTIFGTTSVSARLPTVYMSDANGGMSLFQLPNAQTGDRISHVEGGGEPNAFNLVGNGWDIATMDGYLFATSRNDGLEVFRLGDGTQVPERAAVTGLPKGGIGWALAVSKTTAVVLRSTNRGGPAEILIFDIQSPEKPAHRGTLKTPFAACCAALQNQTLFLGLFEWDSAAQRSTTNLIQSFDISEPSNPKRLDSLGISGELRKLLVAGPGRLLALMKTSVDMIDTTEPQHLSVACEPLNVPAETGVLMPWGTRQLLLTETAGISVGDKDLRLEGPLPGSGIRSASEGDLAIFATGFGGYVYRVRPPPR